MKKRLLISVIVLVLIGAGFGGYRYFQQSTKPVIRTTLSERSKEFIAKQTKQEGTSWDTVNLEKKRAGENDYNENRVTVKNCYSVVVPFQVQDSRQNDPCVYYAILASPRGTMTTSLREVGFKTVDEAPDVTMRKSKPAEYLMSAVSSNGSPVVAFREKESVSVVTGFMMIEGKLFTVSLNIAGSNEVQERQLKKIIESVELPS